MGDRPLSIVKIGGSCFSDKQTPRSFFPAVVAGICEQLCDVPRDFLLVHGGGSFGHPVAKQFAIQDGYRDDVDGQQLGFCLTHHAMMELNVAIVKSCIDQGLPAFPVQPSAIFSWDDRELTRVDVEPVEQLLAQGFVPVLHGDAILDRARGFGILSGDAIIVELCNRLRRRVETIVYLLDVDGLHDKNPRVYPGEARLMRNVILSRDGTFQEDRGDLSSEALSMPSGAAGIDVTGGIAAKISALKGLKRHPDGIYMLDGRAPGAITALFAGTLQRFTTITISGTMHL